MLTIIRLEFIVIGVVYNIFVIIIILECNIILILYLLVFSVCEGALALSLIVIIVRLYGNDYLRTLTILKW